MAVSHFFDACRAKYVELLDNNPIVFTDGGEYEVDECIIKRVRDPTRNTISDIWVQGMLERATGKLVLQRIIDRTMPIMTNLVLLTIPNNSIVYTDEHASYRRFDRAASPYVHCTVNHSRGEYARQDVLADGTPINVHINTLEGFFRHLRSRLAYRARRTLDRVDLGLSEYMYRHSTRSLFDPFRAQ
jgi:hypothetical protein